jgi:hypothetical protein
METKHLPAAGRVVNLLPFISMPDQISIVRLKAALRFVPSSVALAQAGIFIHNGDEIWSFTSLPVLMASFDVIADSALSQSHSRSEIEATPIGRKVLSWLLGKHFNRYLERFSIGGLCVEADTTASRAFFRGEKGNVRKITYLSFTAGERFRKVVVQRHGGRRPWFKNEGFGYQIYARNGFWGVAIEPFYIFTGADTSRPLPFAAQIEISELWHGRDTKTGAAHLEFWEDFLTMGAPLADLRSDHVDSLFLGRPLLRLPQ